MKRTSVAVLVLAAFALCACSTPPSPSSASTAAIPAATASAMSTAEMEKMIIDLEKNAWEDFRTKNVGEIRRHAAPGSKGLYSTGIEDLEQSIKNLNDLEIKSVSFSDWKVSFPVPDTAVVTYQNTNASSFKGKDTSGTFYSSAVWVKVNGEWKGALYAEAKAEPQPKK